MKFSSDIISSRSNPIVKWAASLGEKKYRDAEGAFLVEGEKLSFEALDAGLPVIRVFVEEKKDGTPASDLLKRIVTQIGCGCPAV